MSDEPEEPAAGPEELPRSVAEDLRTALEKRHDRTVEKQREAFLSALRGEPSGHDASDDGDAPDDRRAPASVALAAKIAGVARATVYRWRSEDEDFAKAWDDAYEAGTDTLEDEAKRRSFQGVDKPVFYKGEQVALVREYSDTLLMQQLNARRPEKYRTNHKVEHIGGIKITISPDDAAL